MRLDWVPDVGMRMNDEQECMNIIRDMERRGRPVAITGSEGAGEDERGRKEAVSAEIIRNQVDGHKGYLHEVGNSETSEHINWITEKGGALYQVKWGRTSWITNMAEVSEAAKDARRGEETWESIVETGVRNFMRSKGMITMTEEHSSHVEEASAKVEEGEFWDSVSGAPLVPQLVMQARQEEIKEFRKHDV